MLEGLTAHEIADYSDSLCRRGSGWPKVPPTRPEPSWATLSGFADRAHFSSALARSWPFFPLSGDQLILLKIFKPVMLMPVLSVAIPPDELSA